MAGSPYLGSLPFLAQRYHFSLSVSVIPRSVAACPERSRRDEESRFSRVELLPTALSQHLLTLPKPFFHLFMVGLR